MSYTLFGCQENSNKDYKQERLSLWNLPFCGGEEKINKMIKEMDSAVKDEQEEDGECHR